MILGASERDAALVAWLNKHTVEGGLYYDGDAIARGGYDGLDITHSGGRTEVTATMGMVSATAIYTAAGLVPKHTPAMEARQLRRDAEGLMANAQALLDHATRLEADQKDTDR